MRQGDRRAFPAAAQFGAIGAVAWVGADLLFPRYGLAAVAGVLAVELAVGAVLSWRRAGLAITAMVMCIASANLMLISGFGFAGHRVLDWPPRWFGFAIGSWIVCAVATFVERRVRRAEWDAWERHMADKSGWDILLMRHIPDLRGRDDGLVS